MICPRLHCQCESKKYINTVPARYQLDMWSLHCSQGWFVNTILRLYFNEGIPSSGICASQRLVSEDWLALGYMRYFDIQHTVTLPVEGVSQVWNGVATDNDILLYIADTLLISFQDKKSLSYGTEDKVF